MRLKRVLAFSLLTSLVLCTACNKKSATEASKTVTEAAEENNGTQEETAKEESTQDDTSKTDNTQESNTAATVEEPTFTEKEIEQQESMDAYEKFLRDEIKISFERYMPGYMEKDLLETGKEYTLSEVLEAITTNYFEYYTDKKIQYIDYSYIDCGNDGVNELALCFRGMNLYSEDDDSTLVYIIKYSGDKLNLSYAYETWARSESTMNEYGYYVSNGSGGASLHYTDSGLLDKDGNFQKITSISYESDINQVAYVEGLEQLPVVAQSQGITSGIELQSVSFVKNEDTGNTTEGDNTESFYTFHIYDENFNPIEDPNLYTSSIYKDIFDEAKVPFVTPDEISTMISEKETELGATTEIKEGAEITWKTLGGNQFSEYVGRKK